MKIDWARFFDSWIVTFLLIPILAPIVAIKELLFPLVYIYFLFL